MAAILITGCAQQPTIPSYAEFSVKYEELKEPNPERISFDFEPLCNDDIEDHPTLEIGDCIVKEYKLTEAAEIITEQNNSYQLAIQAANTRLDAISHCEYAKENLNQSLYFSEKAYDKAQLTSTIKSVIGTGICGALIWFK